MERLARFVCIVCLLAFVTTALGTAADPQKKLEETLRRFYEAYAQNKWKTAEQYVDKESRDVFRAQPHPLILKYQISKIELKNEGKEAFVTVAVEQPVPQMSNQPVTMNAMTVWKVSKGQWYMVMGAPPPIPVQMQMGNMLSDKQTSELRFDAKEVDFGIKNQGDVVKLEFPFVNTTDHPVHVTASLVSLCHCIQVGVSKETVAPGERASVLFTLDSKPFNYNYHQGIGITVEPDHGKALLDITGFLNPLTDTASEGAKSTEAGNK